MNDTTHKKQPTMHHNLITDVPGIRVGNVADATICTGVSVVLGDAPMVAAVDVRGGGTGSRELECLSLGGTISHVHAITLAGGSAFGLAAATGVQSWLAEQGQGFAVGTARVPIVPQAILFDLLNGGDKDWGRPSPYDELGYQAAAGARAEAFEIGSVGAGYGATTATARGGLGSASTRCADGIIVGALVTVNAVGSATVGRSPHFWAAPFERTDEFGGVGWPVAAEMPTLLANPPIKGRVGENTTLGIIATNAKLDKAQAHRLAVMAQSGLAKALHPVHTPLDGDIVFAVSTGEIDLNSPVSMLTDLGTSAAETLARAVARGVYSAGACPDFWQGPLAYRQAFPEHFKA